MLLVCSVFLGLAAVVKADFRPYAWTYQFMTMAPGFMEVEIYNTYVEPEKAVYAGAYWQRQLEMETGVIDRMDFSFYLTDTEPGSNAPVTVTDVKLRTRLKLAAEKDDFIVDPLLYVEYTLQKYRSLPDTWEIKLVLAKDIERFNVSVNLNAEEQLMESIPQKTFIFGYAAGASYMVYDAGFWIGLESTGEFNRGKYLLGPSLSYVGEHFWVSAGTLFGLNENSEYVKVRAVIGIVFDLNLAGTFKK